MDSSPAPLPRLRADPPVTPPVQVAVEQQAHSRQLLSWYLLTRSIGTGVPRSRIRPPVTTHEPRQSAHPSFLCQSPPVRRSPSDPATQPNRTTPITGSLRAPPPWPLGAMSLVPVVAGSVEAHSFLRIRPRADNRRHRSIILECADNLNGLGLRMMAYHGLHWHIADVRHTLQRLGDMSDRIFDTFLAHLELAEGAENRIRSTATIDQLLTDVVTENSPILARVFRLSAAVGMLTRTFAGTAAFLHRITHPWAAATSECLRKLFREHTGTMQDMLDGRERIGQETCIDILCTLPFITVLPAQASRLFQLLVDAVEMADDQRTMVTSIMRVMSRIDYITDRVKELDESVRVSFARMLCDIAFCIGDRFRLENRLAAVQHMNRLWWCHEEEIATFFDLLRPHRRRRLAPPVRRGRGWPFPAEAAPATVHGPFSTSVRVQCAPDLSRVRSHPLRRFDRAVPLRRVDPSPRRGRRPLPRHG